MPSAIQSHQPSSLHLLAAISACQLPTLATPINDDAQQHNGATKNSHAISEQLESSGDDDSRVGPMDPETTFCLEDRNQQSWPINAVDHS